MKKLSYEKWCSAFIHNLAQHMNLAGWEITVDFCDEPKPDSENCYAEINSDSVYMLATITIYPLGRKDWDKGDYARITRVLTHELCHILIDPLHDHILPYLSDTTRRFFMDDMENVTQRIALVVFKNLPKHIIPPR